MEPAELPKLHQEPALKPFLQVALKSFLIAFRHL